MKHLITFALVIVLVPFLGACSSNPGSGGAASNATPVATTAAQDVGRDQASAQAAETGSASSSVNPSIMNILAAKKVTITREGDNQTVEVEGSDDSEVTISNGKVGTFEMGNDTTLDSKVQSGSGLASGSSTTTRSGDGGQN